MDPASLASAIHKQLWAVDPDAALIEPGSLDAILNKEEYAFPHFELIVLGAFSTIGLVLIIIGVFSVMAYSVSLQTHEIGTRMRSALKKARSLRWSGQRTEADFHRHHGSPQPGVDTL